MMPSRLRQALPRPRRPARAQLRTRVLVSVLLITLVALAAFDIAAVTALRGYLLDRTDSQLQTVLSLYRPLDVPTYIAPARVSSGKPQPRSSLAAEFEILGPRLRLPGILGQYNVVFVHGHERPAVFVKGNRDLVPALPVNVPVASVAAWTVVGRYGNAPLRLLAAPVGSGTLIATTSLTAVDKITDQLELIVIIGSAAAGLLVALGVALIVRRGLRPIETMAAQADRISAGDLTDRVSPHDPRTEVGRLGTALNGMLTRIEASVREREASQELTQRFFADASHELRNPLASLRANAELYQQGALRRGPQVDEAMRRMALEAQRMSGLVDNMLRLARLDQHPARQDDPVELSALLTECAERAQINSPQHSWHTDIPSGLTTTGDEELLRRAIDNLLANICAHTPEGTAASITAAAHDSTISIDISDNGPGIPADQLPRIFDRFYRAGAPSHRPGSGLGLAIVTAIATAHHGTATATASDPRGLRITVTLPACGQPFAGNQPSAPAIVVSADMLLLPRSPRVIQR